MCCASVPKLRIFAEFEHSVNLACQPGVQTPDGKFDKAGTLPISEFRFRIYPTFVVFRTFGRHVGLPCDESRFVFGKMVKYIGAQAENRNSNCKSA